jgi:protease I
MRLRGKKIAMPVSNEFEDIELLYPLLRLSEEEAWVTIGTYRASFSARPYFPDKPITGRFGTPIPPVVLAEGRRFDIRPLADLSANDFDAIVIPGGFSPDILRREPKNVAFVRDFFDQGKPIAAICHGPWLLISAGIARGRKMTCFVSIKDDVINAGAEYLDQAVVVDGNIITSRMPDDLPDFCQATITSLAGGSA